MSPAENPHLAQHNGAGESGSGRFPDVKERFPGTLTFDGGGSTRAEIQIDSESLLIVAGGSEVGSWPLKYCRVARIGSDEFRLTIDGEMIRFAPLDPEGFGVEAAMRFKASSLADRIGAIRDTGAGERAEDKALKVDPRLVRSVLGGMAILVVAGLAAAAIGWWGRATSPPPSTVAVPATVLPARVDVFSQAPPVFASQWNSVANQLGADLVIRGRIPTGRFEVRLTPRLILQGTIDDGGTLSTLVMSADPEGDAEEDQLVIAAWGIAIAVIEPDLDAPDRKELLRGLGLDIDNPQLEELDGELDLGDHRYTLRYLPEFNSILFTVSEL